MELMRQSDVSLDVDVVHESVCVPQMQAKNAREQEKLTALQQQAQQWQVQQEQQKEWQQYQQRWATYQQQLQQWDAGQAKQLSASTQQGKCHLPAAATAMGRGAGEAAVSQHAAR